MKIACISTSRIPSDTANSIQVMKTCQALARLGHQVHLLVPRWPGTDADPWPALASRYGLTTRFDIAWLPAVYHFRRNDFAFLSVHRARGLGADVIYTWTGQSAVFALQRRFPVLFEVHDMPTGRVGPLWFRAFLRMRGKKRLLPITQSLYRSLSAVFGPIPPEQVVIAPNGVDLEPYEDLPAPPQARQSLGLPEQVTVLCSGHLYAGRGADLFLKLAGRFPQASFVWVGGRPEDVAHFKTLAERVGVGNVLFAGFVSQDRLPQYLAAADVLLMPYARFIAGSSGGNSSAICSPMKMFDYLAAGRAILSSDLPVIHEVLNDENACFAPPEDLEGWTAALARLLADELLRRRLGEQARMDAGLHTWLARAKRAVEGF